MEDGSYKYLGDNASFSKACYNGCLRTVFALPFQGDNSTEYLGTSPGLSFPATNWLPGSEVLKARRRINIHNASCPESYHDNDPGLRFSRAECAVRWPSLFIQLNWARSDP